MALSIRINQSVPRSGSYRSERVRSMFNATDEQATQFTFDLDIPLDLDGDWNVGVIVGPSGTGKSSIGRSLWDGAAWYESNNWPAGTPVVDAIAAGGKFDDVTGALASAGLGDVPVWLRPYDVLSTGQKFRADLARVLAEHPPRIVFDEFTSVVDRQIAQVGAGAFSKAWKRTGGKAVLLSCHYDILDWIEPDWVLDTGTKQFQLASDRDAEGKSWRRPKIDVEIRVGGWELWDFFKQHHYLDLPRMVNGKCYVAFVNGEPVAHLGVATKNVPIKNGKRLIQAVEARASRLVVLPEWQGAGIGVRFLNHVAQIQLDGGGVLPGRRMTTQFQTSHPQLCASLRRSPMWRQLSGEIAGSSKNSSHTSLVKSSAARGSGFAASGFGGHLRAVSGFRYYGIAGAQA